MCCVDKEEEEGVGWAIIGRLDHMAYMLSRGLWSDEQYGRAKRELIISTLFDGDESAYRQREEELLKDARRGVKINPSAR